MGTYAKLQSSILQSTIWTEPDHVRILWITMLAMKDRNGVVEASIPGLASVARIDLEKCEHALLRLSSPDKYSRTSEFDGRRIEPVDGGWVILNNEKYRNDTSTDRVRRHRQKILNETRCNVSSFQERSETHETTSDQIISDQIKEDLKSKKSLKPASSSSKTASAEVVSVSKKYLAVFNAAFDRRCRARSILDRKIEQRLNDGYQAWQIIAAPILQAAIDPSTSKKLRNFGPETLLRDGNHKRTGEGGVTYGATDWLERVYNLADTASLGERLTAMATHYGLTEDILRTGAQLSEVEHESST